MPYYDQADYLLDAVRSVERQTYRNVELIIVDDCSPGPPAQELVGWRDLVPTKFVRHKENLGAARSRNTAVENSAGELIVPLDSDDLLEPTYLEATVSALQRSSAGAVCTAVKFFGDREYIWTPEFSLPKFLTYSGPTTFLYRRAVFDSVGGYQWPLRCGEDHAFQVAVLKKGWQFIHLKEPLYLYRKHGGGKFRKTNWPERIRLLLAEHHDLYLAYLEDVIVDTADHYGELMSGYRGRWEQYQQLYEQHCQQYPEQIPIATA